MRKFAIVALAAAALFTLACNEGSNPKPGAAAGSSPAAPVATDARGLDNPANNKAIVELAKPVLACKWGNYGFDSKCEALRAWKMSDTMKNGADDATLINFLEDENNKVKWLGADGLARNGQVFRKDKVMSGRVIDAADKATDKQLVSALAKAVGNIDLSSTGLDDRVKKMLQSHANADMRQGLAGSTLFRNRDVPGMFELFVTLAKTDKDKKVRKAAAAAFWTGAPTGKNEEVCKLWLELADDADHDLAGHSAYHCAFTSSGGGCAGQWDALLSLIEKKAKAGEVKSSFMASALKYFYGQKKASDAQKKRALKIAKELVGNTKNEPSSRGAALEFVGKEDAGGKAFAAKYDDDKEFFVKNAAKRIREGN